MIAGEDTEQEKHAEAIPRRTITFAAGLQPLLVKEPSSGGIFRTSALIAATPHVPINRKLFTDRCKSNVILRPASSRLAARLRSTSPPLLLEKRCSTAPGPYRPHPFGANVTSVLPEVLQFETWWQAKGEQHRMSIDYCTSSGEGRAGEFHIRGPEEMWLSMNGGSGQQLEHWDLHVGAQLDVLGRKVVLKKASCATTAWLDGWAKLLLQHKERLEAQLSQFAPVVQGQGLVHREPQHCTFGDQSLLPGPSGGRVNLRHLREDVALLAWRLRQHKAVVSLPPELQDLKPEGPVVWSIPGSSLSPQVVCKPFTPKPPEHARASQLLRRSFKQSGKFDTLPSLGETPNSLNQLQAINRMNLFEYILSNPLAASAAVDRRCCFTGSNAAGLQVQVQGNGMGGTGGKTPGPLTGRRPFTTRGGNKVPSLFR